MKFKLIMLLTAIALQKSYAQLPEVFLLNPTHMAAKKAAYKNNDAQVKAQVDRVVKIADEHLADKPASVMEKSLTPPNGSKHDYMSMAPYFWPDPSKADGLPYIRKDGQRNPEIKKIIDHALLSDLETRCKYLSLAYYFTHDEKYAVKTNDLLKVWFIDADTRMNPNLNYAQAVRGVNDGRGIGIIETRALANLADWMGLLAGSKSFPAQNLAAIKDWYKQYLNWMTTSKNGKDEHNAKNNHGTHYDVQEITFALFTGNNELAKQVLNAAKKRIDLQIEPNGEQKLELERTNALGYSTMNLDGWVNMAMLGDRAGVDLWNYTSTDGRSIKKAIDWLMPYALGTQPFKYQQINPYNKDEFYRPVLLMGLATKDQSYLKTAAILRKNESYLTDLLYN
ncbi:alginate lyase family protein [Mucilaginibacter boryungensis]|uniref:Alginate lyase family protein n=1 Tax=Mucilaginibacter boryungensis TaxID=768480 RepID=A0ABR9XFU8_9SPHI|nr:alginate lyase family protein [Mucilaginibacter boryungensis]MBE9666267.1 alginate lyase family protein [Mucilaginibacter boryungensis]